MTKDYKEKQPNQEEVIFGEIKAFPLPVSLLASHLNVDFTQNLLEIFYCVSSFLKLPFFHLSFL